MHSCSLPSVLNSRVVSTSLHWHPRSGAGSVRRQGCSPPPVLLTTDPLSLPQEDDDIEEGDLPEHKRAPPPVDFSKVDPSRPEELLKLSKKGRTVMVFATVSGQPSEKETEEITGLWQGSLFNANYDIQRYGQPFPRRGAFPRLPPPPVAMVTLSLSLFPLWRFVVGSNRAIFMLRDGSVAWEIKDFLVSQERCVDVTVEGQVFPGKAAKKDDAKSKRQDDAAGKGKSQADPQKRAAPLKREL